MNIDRLLCKAKTIDEDEWVIGYYIRFEGGHFIYDNKEYRKIKPETVERSTGVTNNDKVLMFEGDIVIDKVACYRGEIVWEGEEDGIAGFFIKDLNTNKIEKNDGFWHNLKVIGNIYDINNNLIPDKENIEKVIRDLEFCEDLDVDSCKIITNLLKMHIPKPVISKEYIQTQILSTNKIIYNYNYFCPTCYKKLIEPIDKISRCPSCGQALDWSEIKNDL